MAVLYIEEFAELPKLTSSPNELLQAPPAPPLATQTVSIGMSSTASNAFTAATTWILLNTDSACSISIGTTPTASSTTMRMSANETRAYGVPKTGTYKIAVITNT